MQDNAKEYAAEFARRVAGRLAGDWLTPELEQRVFDALSRNEELDTKRRDAWGNWDWPYGRSALEGQVLRPWLDEEIQRAAGSRGSMAWPGGAPFGVCLSHDVDVISARVSFTEALRQGSLHARQGLRGMKRAAGLLVRSAKRLGGKQDALWQWERWQKLESDCGWRSSFLVMANGAKWHHRFDTGYSLHDRIAFRGRKVSFAETLRALADEGWDIGLHGTYTSAVEPGVLAAQKAELEKFMGREVVSTRQHFLHWDPRVTPDLQEACGLRIDSTLGFNRGVGFRSGTAWPSHMWSVAEGKPLSLVQVPMHVMDGPLVAGDALQLPVDAAVEYGVELMRRVAATGGCLVLNWHNDNVANDGLMSIYTTLLQEARRMGAWGGSLRDLLAVFESKAEPAAS
jgi:hypothetical protein